MGHTDGELIRRSIAEPAVFEAMFDRHYAAVLRYARQRAGHDAGEDIASQTFLVAFDRRHTFDIVYASARPWLLGIATNLLRHHARDQASRLAALKRASLDPDMPDVTAELDARVDAGTMRSALVNALESLHHGDRDAFLLSVLADLTYDEVSVALGVPIGTVRSRIHRVRTILREQIEPLLATEDEEDERT